MFCSWKSHPNAPCSCAFRLQHPIEELLNHLCCLGRGTFILRRPGLSLAKSTNFGLHIRNEACGWNILRDAVSGLETDVSKPLQAYLLRDFPDPRPLFALGTADSPVEFTLRLEDHQWASPDLLAMIARFGGTALDCVESHRLGAGAWLDEWEQPKARPAIDGEAVHEAGEMLQRCRLLEVEVRTSAQRGETCFSPSFVDIEGNVLRIADRSRNHIVYADVSADGFHLEAAGSRALRLSHHA